jgi:hypothetical protein
MNTLSTISASLVIRRAVGWLWMCQQAGSDVAAPLCGVAVVCDFDILKVADLSNRKPLLFNHEYASLSPADSAALADFLMSLGDRVVEAGLDAIAYRLDDGA